MRFLVFLLVAPVLAGCAQPLADAPEPADPWAEVDRVGLLRELAPPFMECFQRRDSLIDPLSPIFHGCLDWHSAVHAAYAHHVLYQHTGEERYLGLVEQKLAVAGLSLVPAEHAYMRAKGLDLPLTENPYGFGWFLVLARERELVTGHDDLRPMAEDAADGMRAWFEERLDQGDAPRFILDEAHANYSWSLINLAAWAHHTGDAALLDDVRRYAAPLVEDLDCPVAWDQEPDRRGFQPACLMRLAAAHHVHGEAVRAWVAAQVPADFVVAPVTEPATCHAGGLNFTRAFALHALYEATGEPALRDNAAELVRYHVERPDLYVGGDYLGEPGYLCYGHWVAQIGVRAIAATYG